MTNCFPFDGRQRWRVQTSTHQCNLRRRPGLNLLTLAEAADYLRVPESEVLKLAESGRLPARRIGDAWRVHRDVLAAWLSLASSQDVTVLPGGDDPYLERMLEQIYRERGRPMVEEEE